MTTIMINRARGLVWSGLFRCGLVWIRKPSTVFPVLHPSPPCFFAKFIIIPDPDIPYSCCILSTGAEPFVYGLWFFFPFYVLPVFYYTIILKLSEIQPLHIILPYTIYTIEMYTLSWRKTTTILKFQTSPFLTACRKLLRAPSRPH